MRIYGGLLTENVVQATARDLFVEGWVRLQQAGFDVRFTVYDEYVCNVPIADAQDYLKRGVEIIRTVPAWAQRCPIDVEAKLADRYLK